VQLSPHEIVAALSVEFADELDATQVEQLTLQIERRVKAVHPEIVMLFIKPQSAQAYRAAVMRRYGPGPKP
jgi:divalent metal cation (Fe/Co/Zn/Cd) transporter